MDPITHVRDRELIENGVDNRYWFIEWVEEALSERRSEPSGAFLDRFNSGEHGRGVEAERSSGTPGSGERMPETRYRIRNPDRILPKRARSAKVTRRTARRRVSIMRYAPRFVRIPSFARRSVRWQQLPVAFVISPWNAFSSGS
jgi:hypothetical protein